MKFLNLPSIVGEAHETTFPNLKILFVKQTSDKTHFFYINSSIWNSFLDSIKKVNSLNTFRHNVKKYYLTWIMNNVYVCICVSVFMYVCVSVGGFICTYGYILVCWLIHFHVFPLFSDFRDHNENKTFPYVFCYPSYCWCYSFLSAVIFQLQLLYFNF